MTQVRQLYLAAEVESLDGPRVAQIERKRPAVDVIALEREVCKGCDLGDEGVGPHEAGQGPSEVQTLRPIYIRIAVGTVIAGESWLLLASE